MPSATSIATAMRLWRPAPGSPERTVAEAVALYPFRAGQDFAKTELWTAVERIGVGAIPLVPGETAYLQRWLRRVLGAAGMANEGR